RRWLGRREFDRGGRRGRRLDRRQWRLRLERRLLGDRRRRFRRRSGLFHYRGRRLDRRRRGGRRRRRLGRGLFGWLRLRGRRRWGFRGRGSRFDVDDHFSRERERLRRREIDDRKRGGVQRHHTGDDGRAQP